MPIEEQEETEWVALHLCAYYYYRYYYCVISTSTVAGSKQLSSWSSAADSLLEYMPYDIWLQQQQWWYTCGFCTVVQNEFASWENIFCYKNDCFHVLGSLGLTRINYIIYLQKKIISSCPNFSEQTVFHIIREIIQLLQQHQQQQQ